MERNTILKEKVLIGSDLNALNYATVKQEYKKQAFPKKTQTSESRFKMSSSPFDLTTKKTTSKSGASQRNTIDMWLSKKPEEKECKVSTKSGEHVRKRSEDGREKENRNNDKRVKKEKHKVSTKSVSSRESIIDAHSETHTSTSTRHNLKVTKQHKLKESHANDARSAKKKKSAKEGKESILESDSHQRKLDTYLNNEYKPKKHRDEHSDDNKKLQPASDCPSSSRANRKEDSSKKSLNNNKEPTRRNKADVEQSSVKQVNLNRSSHNSVNKKYKRIISQRSYKEKYKSVVDDKLKGTSMKNDDRLIKDRAKSSDSKYNKLSIKINSNRSTNNFNEKDKSKHDLDSLNSFNKQENLSKEYNSYQKRSRSKTTRKRESKSAKGQENLDGYLIKKLKPDKRKFTRSDSSESCDELPSFKNVTKKAKKPKKDEFLKKYGISIPSVKEILKEKRDLEKYKQKIQSFQGIEDKSFELDFSFKDLNKTQKTYEDLLDCKHLSMNEITAAFKKNLNHISAIFHGDKFNERHEKFYNNTNNYSLTIKDLCSNTSMIVFTFDQIEHMISLLKEEFDPDDKWTSYFFQVLLPELCMNIFMDTHSMTYDETVKYLDTRPIIDD